MAEEPTREVYPNASLRLVTAEFRFPFSPRLAGSESLNALVPLVAERLPIPEPAGQTIELSSLSPQPQLVPSPELGYRFLTRDRMTAVTVQAGRIAIETTVYERWESFRDLIGWTLDVVGVQLGAIVAIDRVGLRYIDEIRVPGEAPLAQKWTPYVDERLLAPAQISGGQELRAMQGVLQLGTDENSELVMRYGTLEGHIVADTGPLRLPTPPGQGPFFSVDIDSYWVRPPERQDEFDLGVALAIAERLHAPVGELFERAITDRLRDEVLRRTP